jgi:hypothetical protein
MAGCHDGEGLAVNEHPRQTPLRLWVSTHENGWEAWIAQTGDGTFTAWACLAGENAVATYIEDSFDHACASAMFDLSRLANHHSCGPTCVSWHERSAPDEPQTRDE